MPGVLSVIVKSARGLPVMDRRSELTDAFVELRFGGNILIYDCRKLIVELNRNLFNIKFVEH